MLGFLVSELLMQADPGADEGSLSRARAAAVNEGALAERARELGLGEAIRLGRGEERQGGRAKPSILADVFEAVVAAVYLDGGIDAARGLVRRLFGSLLQTGLSPARDPKTRLQEHLQSMGKGLPRYEIVAERGPDHAREFEVRVLLGSRVLGGGIGGSKRAAEQAAASQALSALESCVVG